MSGRSVGVLILLLLVFPSVSFGGTFPAPYLSPEQDRTILTAESMVMDRRYREADALFDRMEKNDPGSLLPSMGRLLSLMVQSLEKGAPKARLEEEFAAEFPKNQARMKELERRGNLNAWDHFLLGGSLGVRGLYELNHRRYFSAFLHGMRALSQIHKVAALDPGIHDIAFATGLYKYYRSVKTRYLWFLPFVGDRREEGLAEIRQALEQGHYAVPAAKIALVMLAEREGTDAEGIRLGRKYLREYPNCKLIRDALETMEQRNPIRAGRAQSVAASRF
ncbi:MAG: flagellar biosynthesis anti-sigma factor FlgM [Deltaproteobacteria bacterium]|nr:flagellar biosynthesis anti-sigma factor FlgM [Deltaproteobacteria bacterium]